MLEQEKKSQLPTFRFNQTPEFVCCGVKQTSYQCRFCGPSTDRSTRGEPLGRGGV